MDRRRRGEIKRWGEKYYVETGQLLRRLNADGTVDTDFVGMNSTAQFTSGQGGDFHVYPDGSLVIAGWHTLNMPEQGWVGDYELIWFTNEGLVDVTRTPRTGNGVIYEVEEQPDGKFLLSGPGNSWEGQPVPNIFRVHTDGTLDTSFSSALGWGEATKFTVLADGRILVSGLFKTEFSSPDTLHFVRMMPDGSLDPTFNNDMEVVTVPWLPPEWPGGPIHWGQRSFPQHTVLSDGRIVLHGSHYWVDGSLRQGIAMLDPDGNLMDDPFGTGGCGRYLYTTSSGNFLYGSINGLLESPDGYIYIWGAYHGYDDGTTNDTQQRFVSRLYGLSVGVDGPEPEAPGFELYPNPVGRGRPLTLSWTSPPGSALHGLLRVVVLDAQGRTVHAEGLPQGMSGPVYLHLPSLAPGLYHLRLMDDKRWLASSNVVVE